MHRLRSGLTLVELLIVLAVLGILAAVTIPNAQPATSEHLRAAADMLSADLNYARSLAVMGNSSYRVTFDVNQQRYVLTHTGANPGLNVLPTDGFGSSADPANQRIGRFDRLPILGMPVELVKAAVGSATATNVEYGAMGQTTAPAETVVWLAAGQGTHRRWIPVRVDPLVGLARVGNVQSHSP